MTQIGRFNRLPALRDSDHGLHLDGGDLGDILLPQRYVTDDMGVGDHIRVFVYRDSEDRLVATTETPHVQVGQFACLNVINLHDKLGAFLDWGLSKDLLLPFKEQTKRDLEIGEPVVVFVYIDPLTERIAASMRLEQYLDTSPPAYAANAPVQALVFATSPLGYKVIIDDRFEALLYASEMSGTLEVGEAFQGYVKKVHPDGKIDLRRDAAGYARVGGVAERILHDLDMAGGVLPFNDKTPPDTIRAAFGVSKKAFKQALGSLYKQRLIHFTDTGIVKTDDPT